MSVLFGIGVLVFMTGFYPIARFTEESIEITIHPDHVFIHGSYVYENPYPFPITQGFSIPLPVDKDNPEPVMISAQNINRNSTPIPLRFIMGLYRFNLNFKPKEKILVSVLYRQQAPEKNAHYILTTTQPWRKPLIYGSYIIYAKNVEMTYSNYHLKTGGLKTYYFEQYNFMPQQNWHFSWKII
jgi:hypothetical protein